ncbi:MAG: hypothetical protein AB1416_06090 [Actinomycetota bacterium]
MPTLDLIAEHPGADGRALAVAPGTGGWASCDGLAVEVRDAAGALQRRVASPGALLFGLAYAAGGRALVAAPRILDVATGEWAERGDACAAAVAGLPEEAARGFAVHDAAVSADARLMVVRVEYRAPRGGGSGGAPGGPTVRVVALDTDGLTRRAVLWEGAGVTFTALAAAPGLAAAGSAGAIDVWHADGTPAGRVQRGGAAVTALAFRPDGGTLAGGLADGTVVVWDAAGGGHVHAPAHAGHVRAVAAHPDGARIVTGGEDGRVRVLAVTGEVLGEADVGGTVEAVALAPDGDRVLVSRARPTPTVRVYAL